MESSGSDTNLIPEKANVLPILLSLVEDEGTSQIVPSKYLAEMRLSTEERLEKQRKLPHKSKPLSELNLNTFDVTPQIVIFQNFKPGIIYTALLSLRNSHHVPRPLRGVFEPSPYFTVSYASEAVSTHTAPGMSILFNIKFCAEDSRDHQYNIPFMTEGETFVVPVIAITPRPLLDLPDQIHLKEAVVKIVSDQTFLVHNLGQASAVFSFHINPPFSVSPSKGILLREQNMEVTIYFKPFMLGKYEDYLIVSYQTGEKLSIKVKGIAVNSDISLEREYLVFPDTFMGLTRQKNIKLFNNSGNVAKFQWKLYSCVLVEQEYGKRFKNCFNFMKEHESIKDNKLHTFNIVDRSGHAKIYDRIYEDEIQNFDVTDTFVYQNPNFEIIPVEGELWPEGTINFTIIFSPKESCHYHNIAYLEITGLQERIKLVFSGQGRGPQIQLNLESLNANKIYMCAVHQYEVVANNKGDIPGEIIYQPTESDFGADIQCWPESLHIDPYRCAAFTLQLFSKQEGKFFEEIEFKVSGSDEVIKFILTGQIVCPLLSFEVPEIDYEVVPVGYPVHQPVVLHNPSMVPIEFLLSVNNDGDIPAMTCHEYESLPIKCGGFGNIREFDFSPRSGVVAANSQFCFQLTLTANIIRSCITTLTADLWGSNKHPIYLPIKYTACSPHVVCVPSEINIKFCFVTYPYKRTIVLYNESSFPGYFEVVAQEPSREGGITCTSSIMNGQLQPYQEMEIELTITTTFLGEDTLAFYLKFFGDQPFECCHISCTGQGPVVTTQPEILDFEKVTLLEVAVKNIIITNDSPIPAFLSTCISPKSPFIIEPRTLELQPEQSEELIVSIYLCNPGKVKTKLLIIVENGTDAICLLKAKGVGTSILCEPKIHPELNLGTLLTHQKFTLAVKFTNKGFKGHKMLWSRNKNLKKLKENSNINIVSLFTLTPQTMELAFEESAVGVIEGKCKFPGYIEEDFYCHAMIEKAKSQSIIISFIIRAYFVDPMMDISKNELNFRKDVGPDSTIQFLADELTITNKSNIPIDMDIYLKHPFHMFFCNDPVPKITQYLRLAHNQSQKIIVEFEPPTENKKCFVAYEELVFDYKNHPKSDKVKLTGEVNFPNVEIIPNVIQFLCLPTNTIEYYEILLKNVSPLGVTYHFEWQEEALTIENVQPTDVMVPLHFVDSSFSRKSSDSGSYLRELQMKVTRANESQIIATPAKKNVSPAETLINITDLDMDESGSPNLLPIEYVYQQLCVEKKPSYYYTEIQEPLKSELFMEDALYLSERNKEYAFRMRILLYNLINTDEQEEDAEVIKTLPKIKLVENSVDSMLDIAPACGYLKPYECQLLSVAFHPSSNTSVIAQAHCHVVGGATEVLDITGMSSNLSYSIEEVFVDFGRRVFCGSCEKSLTLTNIGQMTFEYYASAKEFPNPVPTEFLLEAGCLTVTPKHGVLLPGESKVLQIKYFPGIAGEFHEIFTIEIGYLPALTVTVHGYGVFPQTYLFLPKPVYYTLKPSLGYLAIATLTPDYLLSFTSPKQSIKSKLYDEDIPKVAREKLKKDGWIIISYNDLYPSTMDIDLALERIILYQHIYDNPTILLQHTKKHRSIMVPNFITPPYLVDFGYVILETVANYTVLIYNYGPVTADVNLMLVGAKKLPVNQAGLAIQFSRSKIPLGDTKELFVIFNPTAEGYPEVDCDVCVPFYLNVGHGSRIPIIVKAVVTVPTITPELFCINFGEVHCGNCMKKSLILENKGHVISEWKAVVRCRNKGDLIRKHSIDTIRRKPPFFLKNFKGILMPGSGCLLDVYFEPQYAGNVEWKIIITINQNPNVVNLTARGIGLKPILKITEELVEFEPVLPYVYKCEKYFTIENVSEFPIEIYFADFDIEIDEEERIINLLTQFYNRNDLYIPPREAGQKLPLPLIDFYQKVLESLREKLFELERLRIEEERLKLEEERLRLEEERLKIEEEQTPQLIGSLEEITVERRTSVKRKSLTSKNRSQISALRFVNEPEVTDPLLTKTPAEIEILLSEHLEEYAAEINQLQNTPSSVCNVDPVTTAILEAKGPHIDKDPTVLREGIFIIFHGGPNTRTGQAANKAGLETGLPVYSLDRLFLEGLASNTSLASVTVNEVIHRAFKEVASEIDLVVAEGTDSYDEIQKKVDLLLSGKEKKPKPSKKESKGDSKKSSSKKSSEKSSKKEKKSSKKSSSKGSSKKEKKKKKDTRPTFIGIPEPLLFDILKQRLSLFQTGIIIESLNSTFLRQPLLALNNILKAIGNVQYIQCIILSFSYAENLVFEENLKQLAEKKIIEERELFIQTVLDMDGDQFMKLLPEELAIFREYVLKQRKLKTIEKREALKKRLMDRKLGKKPIKGKGDSKDAPKKKVDSSKGVVDKKSKEDSKVSSAKPPKSGKAEKKSSKGTSTKSSKSKKGSKDKKGKAKLSPEEAEIKLNFNTFENDLRIVLHILEYWDRKTCMTLKPLPALKPASKGKSSAGRSTKPASGKKAKSPSKISLLPVVPIENTPITPEMDLKFKQTGIACWLLLNAHRDKPIENMVAEYLHHTSELAVATKTLEESLKEKLLEEVEEYTVLHSSTHYREKNVSDIFILRDSTIPIMPSSDFTKQIIGESSISLGSELQRKSADSKISVGSKIRKRRRSSGRSTTSNKQSVGGISPRRISGDKISLISEKEIDMTFTSRAVLGPAEKFRYGIFFKPEACGSYEHTFTIEMTGWPSKYYLTCAGKCDIPSIDMTPERIFANTTYRRFKKNMYSNNLFLKESGVFDFGPILMQQGEDLSLLAIDTIFLLTNSSFLPCYTSFNLRDDTVMYYHEPAALTIEPMTTEALTMISTPSLKEPADNQLIISIKNNPKIETINLTSETCKLEFHLNPKVVDFARTLINQTGKKSVLLENDSLVPINWALIEPTNVLEHFSISQLQGCVAAKSSHEIFFEYSPTTPEDVPLQQLGIEIYDKEFKCISPLHRDSIAISAEAIEMVIECLREIHLGEVKGRFQHIISYTILNKGKYNAEFSFGPVFEDEDPLYAEHKHIRNYFSMTPPSGVLVPNKVSTIKLNFFANKVAHFKNVPILNCVYTEALYKSVIDMFPLMAFGTTFLSNYQLCPPQEINFGHQLAGTEKIQEMTLTNYGQFEFNYAVLSLRKLLEMKDKQSKKDKKGKGSSKSSKSKSKSKGSKPSKKSKKDTGKGKKSSKSSKSDKSAKKKPKPTKLDAGMFSVISSTGIVEPNETCTIQVFSRPKQPAKFEEIILFFVSECSAREKNGRIITLNVTGCAPSINFEDYDRIFREQYIVNRFSDFECPKEIEACSVFIKEEMRLHFSRVLINKQGKARICLENNGPIPTDVVVTITSLYENVFSVDPNRFNVDSYSSNYTTVSFMPNYINTFYGTLNIGYDCPAALQPGNLQLNLSGEGLVPEIALRQPVFDDTVGCFAINFNPTLVGCLAHHTISFENIGIIACRVIIEVCDGSVEAFTLIPHNNIVPLLKVQEEVIQATAHTNLINLQSGQMGEFELHFSPTDMGHFNCLVKLHIVNNPFETIMIFITAQAYQEDITIEGLPSVAIKQSSSSEDLLFKNPGYELDFGYCFINQLQKKYFKLTNHSTDLTYKFEFSSYEKLMCTPTVGHLKPKATKDVIATFLSKKPTSLSKEPFKCTIYRIEYLNPELEALSWDDRQNFVIWEPTSSPSLRSSTLSANVLDLASVNSRRSHKSVLLSPSGTELGESSTEAAVKTIRDKYEPPIEIIPGTLQCLPMLLTAICDYASYECNEEEINMEDTLAFETRLYTFNVTNTSDVSLNLSWKISFDEEYRRRINSAACNHINPDERLSGGEASNSDRLIHSAGQIPTATPCSKCLKQRPVRLTGTEHFLPDDSLSNLSVIKSSLFSSEGNLSNCSKDSLMDDDTLPFIVTPNSASILPKQIKTFKITFMPKVVYNYVLHIKSDILNLNPLLKPLKIPLKARSLLPLVYFDIENNDYLERRRKGRKICRDIADENTRVVEFEAIGLRINNTRTFNILNPTEEGYYFAWTLPVVNGKDVSLFHCHKPEGFVEKGKMAQAIFSFLPQAIGTFETFYTFHITKYNLSKTFLLVGIVREPNIYFSNPYLELKPTILGVDVIESVVIKNSECFEVDFKFKNDSLYSDARLQVLAVQPLKGIIGPQSEQLINITFHPIKKGEVSFNLKCIVEKMKKPLLLTVTANCFEIQSIVFYISSEGDKVMLKSDETNVIDLKAMSPHIKEEMDFTIANAGIIGFYYSWDIKQDLICNRLKINFNDKEGYITSKSDTSSILSITPLTKVVVKKLKIKLQIRYGPTYLIHLMGTASEALFIFSIDEYDFGPCLIQREETAYYTKYIEFTNNEETAVMLESKIPDQDFLSLNFKSKLINPKKSEQLLITFYPREIKHYYIEIEFFINSKLHVLKFRGEGVLYCIDLYDPQDNVIELGAIPIGKVVTRTVKVVNNSTAPVDIIFNLYDRLPYFSRPQKILKPEFEIEQPPPPPKISTKDKKDKKDKKKGKSGGKSKSSKSAKSSKKGSKKDSKKGSKKSKSSKSSKKEKGGKAKKEKPEPKIVIPVETPEQKEYRLIRAFVTFSPKKFTRVAPQEITEFTIKFAPTERMKSFTEKVSYQIQDNMESFCIFKASALGPEYVLEKNSVDFGSIIHGCLSKKKLVLYNRGELGGPFKWSFVKPQIYFTIVPKEGYISPGSSVTFTIKFKPTHISCLIQAKAQCTIISYNIPLPLALTGSCFAMPAPTAILKFSCPVRESDRKNIVIQNPTGQTWKITPIINGRYFFAPGVLPIYPKSSESCEITYKPLTMSKEKPHEATVFFPLPEGKGLLYNLIGTALSPLVAGTITTEIVCKTYHSEILNVKNWLKTPQKFTVQTKSGMPYTPINKTLYKLTGNDDIDVPSQSERDYTWTIYVLNEGTLKFKVIFENVATSEYLMYEIVLTVTKCPSLDVIKLTTCIRIPLTHTIKLQNPIKSPVAFTIQSSSPELSFQNNIVVAPYSEHPLVITYTPLTLGETEAHLDISTKELGMYPYDFVLTAHSPIPESYVCFTAGLGQTVSQKAILFNTAMSNQDFISEIQHPGVFYLNKTVSALANQKTEFDIYFEPSNIGDIQSTLTLSTPATGQYIYPLIGTCTLPKPQGPYFIKPGGHTVIFFKNPFNENAIFSFSVEPAIFGLKSTSEAIKSRRDVKIIVTLVPFKNLEILIDQKYPITGKLVVYSTESNLSYIKFTYYLQGDLL